MMETDHPPRVGTAGFGGLTQLHAHILHGLGKTLPGGVDVLTRAVFEPYPGEVTWG
jgi:hypothetical protein